MQVSDSKRADGKHTCRLQGTEEWCRVGPGMWRNRVDEQVPLGTAVLMTMALRQVALARLPSVSLMWSVSAIISVEVFASKTTNKENIWNIFTNFKAIPEQRELG